MYVTGDESCPVKTARVQRTDPEAESLFNQCVKTALQSPTTSEYWYTAKAMKPYQFSKFMPDISKNSGCSKRYTAHCLRSTAIQALNDEGFELLYTCIMYISGHRKASVRSKQQGMLIWSQQRLGTALYRVARPGPSTGITAWNESNVGSALAGWQPLPKSRFLDIPSVFAWVRLMFYVTCNDISVIYLTAQMCRSCT